MVEIKEEYNNQFNVALADDIRKNYTGNTSKILLALIKGKQIVREDFFGRYGLPTVIECFGSLC